MKQRHYMMEIYADIKRAYCYRNYHLLHWKFPMMVTQHSVKSYWLLNTQSRVLQADWLTLEIMRRQL